MEKEAGCVKIWTDEGGRRIVYSRGTGIAHAHEIAWLYETIVEFSKEWHDDKGFVYMAFIEELEQVSPKGSIQYVELHRNLESGVPFQTRKVGGNNRNLLHAGFLERSSDKADVV